MAAIGCLEDFAMRSNQPADVTDVLEDRSFRAFHSFMRASRAYMDATVYDETWHS